MEGKGLTVSGRAPVKTPDQEYCIVGLAAKNERLGANFYGAYSTLDKAQSALSDFRKSGFGEFDIGIAEMYNFGLFPPPASIPRQYYQEPLKCLMRQSSESKLPESSVPGSLGYRTPTPVRREESIMVQEGAPIVPIGQEYFVIAISQTKEKELATNFLGAYPSLAAAETFCQTLRKEGFTQFPLFKVKMNHFIDFPPPEQDTNSQYHQDVLKSVMQDQQKADADAAAAIERRQKNQHLENELFQRRRETKVA